MSRQEKLRRLIRRQYVRRIVQKILCIEKDIIKLFYAKTWKVWNNYYYKFNEQVQTMKFGVKLKALEFLYGGTKFYTKSSEKYEFKNKEFLYHNMKTLMEIDGITENEAQIKRTASSLNISGQKSVSARTCDCTCNVSKLWSLDLHMSLSKLNPELELFDFQNSIVEFEHCCKCFKNEYPSCVGKKCNDHLKLISALAPHYQHMRTLSRRIYETDIRIYVFFENRWRAFLNTVILDPQGPVGIVTDYFWRLEIQARGAPHIHMKIWVEKAPIFGVTIR
jgi:hypothetical protein